MKGRGWGDQATVPMLMDANSSFEVSSPNQDRAVVELQGRLVAWRCKAQSTAYERGEQVRDPFSPRDQC
jgi:hypothetical protein